MQTNILLEINFRSRCRDSCSLQFRGGRIADNNYFGHNFYFIADTDTEKYYFRIISTMNLDKRYVPLFSAPSPSFLAPGAKRNKEKKKRSEAKTYKDPHPPQRHADAAAAADPRGMKLHTIQTYCTSSFYLSRTKYPPPKKSLTQQKS